MLIFENAESIEEAVAQFYENPDKYSHGPVQSPKLKPVPMDHKKKSSDPPLYSPPPYAPASIGSSSTRHRKHTNAIIEAADVRARDEVCDTNQ